MSGPSPAAQGERPAVVVIHGPNLNLLGSREPSLYGTTSLAELNAGLVDLGLALGVHVDTCQANDEGAIIDRIQQAGGRYVGIVINPGGFSHTSVAIHDALRSVDVPAIEVHLTNLYARESFRHASVTGGACAGVVMGLGVDSYHLALRHLAARLHAKARTT